MFSKSVHILKNDMLFLARGVVNHYKTPDDIVLRINLLFTLLYRVFHLLQIVYSFSMEILENMNSFTIISILF